MFKVTRSKEAALVQIEGKTFKLVAKPSSLGTRYAGAGATLIIDNDFAAFVTGRDHELSGCTIQEGPIAGAQDNNPRT